MACFEFLGDLVRPCETSVRDQQKQQSWAQTEWPGFWDVLSLELVLFPECRDWDLRIRQVQCNKVWNSTDVWKCSYHFISVIKRTTQICENWTHQNVNCRVLPSKDSPPVSQSCADAGVSRWRNEGLRWADLDINALATELIATPIAAITAINLPSRDDKSQCDT